MKNRKQNRTKILIVQGNKKRLNFSNLLLLTTKLTLKTFNHDFEEV